MTEEQNLHYECPPTSGDSVKKIYTNVPRRYEFINHLLTGGMDILWRKRAACTAAAYGGTQWIDVCTGTGEMAVYLSKLAPEETEVTAVDFSPEMIEFAAAKPESLNINFVQADVTNLPFDDNSFDILTISFAARNIHLNRKTLVDTFREFHRVLRPGGAFINVETSQPGSLILRKLFHLIVRCTVRPAGRLFSKTGNAYSYLAYTIPRWYSPDELAAVIREAGFGNVTFKTMFFGAAAIHTAEK